MDGACPGERHDDRGGVSMKGMGTFRRLMSVMGLNELGPLMQRELAPTVRETREDRGHKPRKRHRKSSAKGWQWKRKDWPVLYWGDCPAPVSRKVLKRLTSGRHYDSLAGKK